MNTDSSTNILFSFFPLIENGLVQIISRLDPNYEKQSGQNLFREKYPRCIGGYTKTVDLFVSYAQKSPESSILFLISILPSEYGNDSDNDTSLYTKINNDIQKANINNPCSQQFIDLLLLLFFADCTAQTLSANTSVSIFKELIGIANSTLKPIANSDEELTNLQTMIIKQFSVILSFISIDHASDVLDNFYNLLDNSDVNQVLLLNRYIRLTINTTITLDTISQLLERLLNMEITPQWADAMQPIIMQLSIDIFPSLNQLLTNIIKKIDSCVNIHTGKSKKKSSETSKPKNDDSFITLYAICMIRQEKDTGKLTSFLENVICSRIDDSTVGCLSAFLVFLRGPFVSKANLFWEWGSHNRMGHPGIEVTHLSSLDTKSMGRTFSTLCNHSKVHEYPKLVGDILTQFAGRDFMYFCGHVIPMFVSKMKKNKMAFKSLNLCLNKIVEPELRFSEWAQENPANQNIKVSEIITVLFLQLKTTLYLQAKEYNLERSTKFAFNFHLIDSVDFPQLNLPVAQENIAPEFRETVEKWYKHQHQILDNFDIFDDEPSSIEDTRHSKDDNSESQNSQSSDFYFDLKIRPQKKETLEEQEQLYINILSFFPRIMNKSDFLSSVGNQLFNSMVCECPAVSLYSIMIVNHLFTAKPEDRLDIMDALMEKTVKTTNKEFLFVFLSFLIKLFDLSLAPKTQNNDTIYNFILKAEAFCVFMMANDSYVIQCLANALTQRIYRFARGMKMESNLYQLITQYQNEIDQNIIKKVKLQMVVSKDPLHFMTQMRLVEVMNLMNLKAPYQFFKHLQDFVIPCIQSSQNELSQLNILLSYSTRYLDGESVANIQNRLELERKLTATHTETKQTKGDEEDENDDQVQTIDTNSFSSFYPISIFSVEYSDENSMELQSKYVKDYLISNAYSLTSIHWTTAVLLLDDLYDKLNELQENSITEKEINKWVSIFLVIMKSADIKFALLTNEKVQQSVMKFIDIYIDFYSNDGQNADKKSPLDQFPDFCIIITTVINSFIIQNHAYREGSLRKPFLSPNSSKLMRNQEQYAKIFRLFDTLIFYSNQMTYFKHACRPLSAILQAFPILDERSDYLKGQILTIQDSTIIAGKTEEEIYRLSAYDLLTFLCQTLNDVQLYGFPSMMRNGNDVYNALCCNHETLLPLLFEYVFSCPFFFIPLYNFFVGTDINTNNLEESDVKFNKTVIDKFAGRTLFMSLFFMMSNLSSIRMMAMNLLKRVFSLFFITLYQDNDRYKRMMVRFAKFEPSFLLFTSDYEIPPISLLCKFAQLIIMSFPSLKDDIINSAIDCLNSIKILHNDQSNTGIDNYFDLNYYKNQEIYYMPSKSELQTNILQLMSIFLRSFSLETDSSKYTPYMLVRKLLTVCDPSEPNTTPGFFTLFDQLCNDSPQLVEQVVDYLLDFHYAPIQPDDLSNIKSLLVHFAINQNELLLKSLSLRLSFLYWYAATVPMYQNNESPDLENIYLLYRPIVSAFHMIILNSPLKTSNTEQSIAGIPIKFLPRIIVFCLIFYNKTSSALLMSLLGIMDCSENVLQFGREPSNQKNQQESSLIPINETKTNTDDDNDSESFTVFSPLPHGFLPTLLECLKNKSEYGRDFINEIGSECLRWCNGCGDLHVAGRACIVFSQILRPFDTSVFESLYQTMCYILSIPNIFTISSLQGKVSTAQEYLAGLFTLFNAVIDTYKAKKSFANSFKLLYSISVPFLSIPYFDTQIKSKSHKHNHHEKKLDDSNSSFSLSDVNNYYELSNQIITILSKSILNNIFDLNKSNQELIRILPAIACNSVTMRPRASIDAFLLSIFNPNRVHNIENEGDDDENADKETELLSIVAFIIYFPWVYSAFAAFHNIEPYSSLFSDSEIPRILQTGLLMGSGIQLPNTLCVYILAALKEPESASVDDFPLQVGITIAKASPQAIVAAAPILIEMASFAGSQILKFKSDLNNQKKDKKKKSDVNDEVQNDDDDYESEDEENDDVSIFENKNNNITFLLSIITLVRSFLEYADFTDGVEAFAPLIPIATSALEAYEEEKDDDYQISYSTSNSSGLNSVSLDVAKEKLRSELSKLMANLLSLAGSMKKKQREEEAEELHEEKKKAMFSPQNIEKSTWSSVSKEVIGILKKESMVNPSQLFPVIKASSKGYYKTDLNEPIILIPLDNNVWNTTEVINARNQVQSVRVTGVTQKLMNIEAARLAQPSTNQD